MERSNGLNRLRHVTASVVTYSTPPDDLATVLRCLVGVLPADCVAVIDNAPDPGTQRLAAEFGARYIRPECNLGYGAGHNRALALFRAVSKYHIVMNPDIQCGLTVVPKLFSFMEANPDVGLLMPRVLYPDGTLQQLCKQIPSPFDLLARRFMGPLAQRFFSRQLEKYELRHLDLGVAREVPCLSGCFMFLRMSVLDKVGFFDERYFMYMEDFDLCRRIGAASRTVFYPDASVVHGYAKGSYRDYRLLKFHLISAIKYFNKWGWFHDPERKSLNRRTAVLSNQLPPRNLDRVTDPSSCAPAESSSARGQMG